MHMLEVIRSFIRLKKGFSQSEVCVTAESDSQDICWSELLSKYIGDSIDIYVNHLKKGVPQSIHLVFQRDDYLDELQPYIYIKYCSETILIDYDNLRYGHFGKRNSELQKQCVRAAETDYIEFRKCVTDEQETIKTLFEIQNSLENRFSIPVECTFD